jgi:Fe2+ transport system protein FeoA
MTIKIGSKYTVNRIESSDTQIIQRLHDLGLYAGVTVSILNIVSLGSVYILQFDDSIVALNQMEMSCLSL